MSQRPERLRRISHHISRVFTGLAAGLLDFMPRIDRVEMAFARGAIDPAKAPAESPEGGAKAADTSADAQGSTAAATEAAARPERGPGERANPAAPQDLPGGMAPADVRRGIARESCRTGDSRGVTERASEPPPRVASPRHGQVGDLRDRVDQVGNDQARIAQQLVQLSDQARAAWRAAQEVAGQLRQVNRSALKR